MGEPIRNIEAGVIPSDERERYLARIRIGRFYRFTCSFIHEFLLDPLAHTGRNWGKLFIKLNPAFSDR